jgi:hypothetical protein
MTPPKCKVCGTAHYGTCHMPAKPKVAKAKPKKRKAR